MMKVINELCKPVLKRKLENGVTGFRNGAVQKA